MIGCVVVTCDSDCADYERYLRDEHRLAMRAELQAEAKLLLAWAAGEVEPQPSMSKQTPPELAGRVRWAFWRGVLAKHLGSKPQEFSAAIDTAIDQVCANFMYLNQTQNVLG